MCCLLTGIRSLEIGTALAGPRGLLKGMWQNTRYVHGKTAVKEKKQITYL